MREAAGAGCHHAGVTWDQMPVDDDQWTPAADDCGMVEDWAEARADTVT